MCLAQETFPLLASRWLLYLQRLDRRAVALELMGSSFGASVLDGVEDERPDNAIFREVKLAACYKGCIVSAS